MDDCVDLEIRINPAETGSYGMEFVLRLPGSAAEARPLGPQGAKITIDPLRLGDPLADPAGYGQKLADQLLADRRAVFAYAKAGSAAQGQNLPLRVRLAVSPGSPELHRLVWELLADPEEGTFLSTRETVLLSRVLIRTDGRPVVLAEKRALTALIAVAAPANLDEYNLAPILAGEETGRAQAGMEGVRAQVVKAPVTLPALLDALQAPAGGFDIFYLVCHGKNTPKGYVLYLEDGQGQVRPIPGEDFIAALKGLNAPPRLIVTPACESAASGADGTAFAARLAETGAAAVLGMQIPFSMATEARFLPVFFRELAKDGVVDRACSAARRAVADRPDFWAPALWMALNNGKIWKDEETEKGAKYQVTVTDSKGVVVGDHNTVTQSFDGTDQPPGRSLFQKLFGKKGD